LALVAAVAAIAKVHTVTAKKNERFIKKYLKLMFVPTLLQVFGSPWLCIISFTLFKVCFNYGL
jgi:hypothetical protein